ncbi:YNG2 [Candida jiufengensis]|uniref:YNG2 n=1 Tax=Candida jiufengensis TaxID=497108 RepID=UPI002223EEF5|nr:YNG2 [Candida jiufengensis]KAI5951510.1 YNG2 [Candida jiufengensis]
MDTSTVLEKYTQDLSNLPLEVRHLLEEIKSKDIQVVDLREQCQSKDNQIHKFIRANGTLTKHPKEQQLYSKIEDDMKTLKKLQKEKILLSNTALFLISKHLFNFEADITKLERDELLPPLEAPIDLENLSKDEFLNSLNGLSDSLSATPTPRNPLSMTPAVDSITTTVSSNMKKGQKRKQPTKGVSSSGSTPGATGSLAVSSNKHKKLKSEEIEDVPAYETGSLAMDAGSMDIQQGEDADNNLYCFCQRVSFGEMIGCDNDDCKYEWFHWSCVGITSPPKDDEIWYCPDCRTKKKKRRN